MIFDHKQDRQVIQSQENTYIESFSVSTVPNLHLHADFITNEKNNTKEKQKEKKNRTTASTCQKKMTEKSKGKRNENRK